MRQASCITMIGALALMTMDANGGQKQPAVTIWQGEIHFGDNPEAYPKTTSAGMAMQIPFKASMAKKYRLTIKAGDVETLAGDGHYAEVFAHYQENNKTKDVSIQVFRIKDDSGQEKDFSFELTPKLTLKAEPAYYSVKIRVDTSIPFGLWDDFVVKAITLEPLE